MVIKSVILFRSLSNFINQTKIPMVESFIILIQQQLVLSFLLIFNGIETTSDFEQRQQVGLAISIRVVLVTITIILFEFLLNLIDLTQISSITSDTTEVIKLLILFLRQRQQIDNGFVFLFSFGAIEAHPVLLILPQKHNALANTDVDALSIEILLITMQVANKIALVIILLEFEANSTDSKEKATAKSNTKIVIELLIILKRQVFGLSVLLLFHGIGSRFIQAQRQLIQSLFFINISCNWIILFKHNQNQWN